LLAGVGMGGVLINASGNTLVQMTVEDSKRGRISSLFTVSFIGAAPLGNLALGFLAHHIGAGKAILASAGLCLFCAMFFLPKLFRSNELILADPNESLPQESSKSVI